VAGSPQGHLGSMSAARMLLPIPLVCVAATIGLAVESCTSLQYLLAPNHLASSVFGAWVWTRGRLPPAICTMSLSLSTVACIREGEIYAAYRIFASRHNCTYSDTKIIRSGITLVSRNAISHRLSGVSLLAVSNVNNPVGSVCLPYVMRSAHFFVTHIQTEKISSWNGPTVHVWLLYVSALIH
jgi:hypothetical protein